MSESKIKIGFAMCGSFCTFESAIEQMRELSAAGHEIIPIMSKNAYQTDTRFGSHDYFNNIIQSITGREIIASITAAEPIGPKSMTDVLIVAPCTGNTLAKLNAGITDTPVLMAIKSHLRCNKPVVIALATNDALGSGLKNIGQLLNTKHIYFVPFGQDDPIKKPKSMISHMELLSPTMDAAMHGQQLQPVLC